MVIPQKLLYTAAAAASSPQQRRVAVTGIGAVCPLGSTFAEAWQALMRGDSGATTLSEALRYSCGGDENLLQRELDLAQSMPCQVAAPVSHLDISRDARTARFVQMALLASREAMQHSGLDTWLSDESIGEEDGQSRRERAGVCIGSGMSAVREITEAYRTVQTSGYRRLSPHFVPKVLTNTAAGRVSMEFGLLGPNHAASTACAASSHALGDALRMIQRGDADVMVAGGAEACIDTLSLAGFGRLRALSTRSDVPPDEASRPFDVDRDGFVMAEGAVVLVLEELEHARARGAPCLLAELCGYGLSADAYHATAPDPEGRGASRAMRAAMQDANVKPSEVQYVNAHATSTPKGDEIEARVISATLCGDADRRGNNDLWVSGTKGSTGHLLGAAGAMEAAFTVQSLYDQRIPATRNLNDVEEEVRFRHVPNGDAVDASSFLEVAMSNSFGFGGTNASLVFRRIDE